MSGRVDPEPEAGADMPREKRKSLYLLTFLFIAVSLSACGNPSVDSTIYKNAQYGFDFALPESWRGYTIVTAEWEGLGITDSQSGKIAATGPQISIRHPLWTSQEPRQDIPIMIFTLDQWASLLKEEFHVGAAPIPPSELGRNAKYVFALPARYNFAFPTGFEEVEDILKGHPLKPMDARPDISLTPTVSHGHDILFL